MTDSDDTQLPVDSSADDLTAALSDGDVEEAARQLFVHGVTGELLGSDAAAVEADLQRAMARIDASRSGRVRRVRRIRRILAVAAALLVVAVGIGWYMVREPPDLLLADVSKFVVQMQTSRDRQYRIVIEKGDVTIPRREGMLFVRRDDCFAISLETLRGTLWFGRHGDSAWIVPARHHRPVFVGPADSERWQGVAGISGVGTPVLQLKALLGRLRLGYRFRLPANAIAAPDQDHPNAPTDRIDIIGVRRWLTPRRFPRRVHIVADRVSGLLETVDLRWGKRRAAHLPRRMSWRLVGTQAQADAIYRHDGHHLGDRGVRELR